MNREATASGLLTIDVEEWYMPAVMERYVPRKIWDSQPLRLQESLRILSDLLDDAGVKATFFCLSCLPEEDNKLIRQLSDKGHEIASHGHSHRSLYGMTTKEIREELVRSRKTLEDITGKPVVGFRAPNFSITDDTIVLLAETGYQYDSSLFRVRLHPGYGRLRRHAVHNTPYTILPDLIEVPMSLLPFGPLEIPWSGGAYFRHFPTQLFQAGVKKLLDSGYYNFYIHPWEVDRLQPRPEKMSLLSRLRHYRNIPRGEEALRKLLQEFPFGSVLQHLTEQGFVTEMKLSPDKLSR